MMVLASFVTFYLVSLTIPGWEIGCGAGAVDSSPTYLYGDIPTPAWEHILPEIAKKFG